MHERGVAHNVLHHVIRHIKEKQEKKSIKAIFITLGEQSGIERESFESGLADEMVERPDLFGGAKIEITMEAPLAVCSQCDHSFVPDDFPSCPKCSAMGILVKGNDIRISYGVGDTEVLD